MLTSILVLLALAALAPVLHRFLGQRTGWVLGAASASLTVWFATRLPLERALGESWSWVPSLGVDLAFRLDGLSLVFALLVTGIGALVLVYAQGYFGAKPKAARLFSYLLLFEAAMLGVVLSDDLVSLFVFWELTSVASFLMVGFDHEKEGARRAARKALVITGAGGLALLAGLIMLRLAAIDLGLVPSEAVRISALAGLELSAHPWYGAILTLVLLGAFTKSAQVPFHIWLPAAMAAPTPVSAYLHSATMVKAGVFLLARLHPTLGGTDAWHFTVSLVGLVTMLCAAWMALRQTDLKKILAYSTVSVLGILTALLGLGTELSIKAMVVFLVAHALYKAALFMVAGVVDHQAGTRDAGVLAGLGKLMPVTAAAGLLAAVSKAGAPPMFGFVGKELLYKAKLDLEVFGELVVLVAVLTNVALVATALLVGVKPFWGRRPAEFDSVREAPAAMLVGPGVLAALGIFVGLVPASFDSLLGGPMASAIVGAPVEMKLALWYGVNPSALAVLGLSILTLLAGVLLYVRVLHRGPGQMPGPSFTLESLFERTMDGLPLAAGWLTRLVHGGSLRRDLGIAAIVAAVLVLVPLWSHVAIPGLPLAQLTAVEVASLVLIVAGAIAALAAHGTLRALLGLGSTGLGISLLFLLLGAPDLALTQLMVETLTVVLLAVVLLRLPDRHQFSTPRARVRDGIIAGAVGLAVGLTVLVAGEVRLEPGIAEFFAQASVPEAKGRNIVNVILVDFRALDTLGETVVLALAGVGILALLRARGLRSRKEDSA